MNWLRRLFTRERGKDPLDNVTPRAQRLLVLARKHADRLQNPYVGTEHLLLGLIDLKEGVGLAALSSLKIDPESLRKEIESRSVPGKHPNGSGSIPYTPMVKKALQYGAKEAREIGHEYLGSEHVLLGALRLRYGIASQALNAAGIEIDKVRAAVQEVLRLSEIMLREVEPADLDTFFAQQLDPEANRMAAFVGKDPADRAVFNARWEMILQSPQITQRTIVADGQVAGYIGCYPHGDNLEVTYWLGREYWGKGLATAALQQMLRLVTSRPITARAATDNLGSLRVLQKCGFKIVGTDKGFAHGRGGETEEYLLRLDE
jgi:RimJ/RimL family protein N-acetyltransferase